MSELKPRITKNGIDYILVGDETAGRTPPHWKVWTAAPGIFKGNPSSPIEHIDLDWELWTYLADLNEQAQERLDTIMEQMKAAEGVTEELKRTHQMEWVQRCNNIHNRAEEIILREIIYS